MDTTGDRRPEATPSGAEAISVPILPARDIPETLALFEKLGFEVHFDQGNGYAVVRRGTIELHFTLTPDLDPWTSNGMAFIRLADVGSLYEELKATGALPVMPMPHSEEEREELGQRWERGESIARLGELADRPWGIREFALMDPSNNLLRFGQILA